MGSNNYVSIFIIFIFTLTHCQIKDQEKCITHGYVYERKVSVTNLNSYKIILYYTYNYKGLNYSGQSVNKTDYYIFKGDSIILSVLKNNPKKSYVISKLNETKKVCTKLKSKKDEAH